MKRIVGNGVDPCDERFKSAPIIVPRNEMVTNLSKMHGEYNAFISDMQLLLV